jgi:hypothetical protein
MKSKKNLTKVSSLIELIDQSIQPVASWNNWSVSRSANNEGKKRRERGTKSVLLGSEKNRSEN